MKRIYANEPTLWQRYNASLMAMLTIANGGDAPSTCSTGWPTLEIYQKESLPIVGRRCPDAPSVANLKHNSILMLPAHIPLWQNSDAPTGATLTNFS